jgi:protein-L-isoaspartate(D-aspartate) O-methyltransferase
MAEEEDEEEEMNIEEERRQEVFAAIWRQMMGEAMAGRAEQTNAGLIARLKSSQTLKTLIIEQALLDIPREYFVTADLKPEAYLDNPLRFSKMGFNISAPHMYVLCLENLNIQAGDKVLDIGSGSGYFTLLSGYLTGPTGLVHGFDLYEHIIEFAQNNIKSYLNDEKVPLVGRNFDYVKFFRRNCFLPSVDGMKYDKIHVGACCPDAKIQELYDLLVIGGVLVTPYGDRLIKAVKKEDGMMDITTLVDVRYSDLLLPSLAEIKEAQKQIEIAKANIILVPPDQRNVQFAHVVNNKICSDILFEVQGRPIYAHKLVFKIMVPAFYKMIEREEVIKVEKFSSEAYLSMLNFLYTGSLTAAPEYWNEILDIAVNHQIESLENTVKMKMDKLAPVEICTFDMELSKFVGNELYADITFCVEDKIIPAHKLVVVAQSEHFRKMFSGSYRESQSGAIQIFDCTVPVFSEVLHFLYTGQCNIVEDNCFSILEQANFFQLGRLTAMCELFWYEHINIDNAASILEYANHFNAAQLKQFAMEYIFKYVHDVTKTVAWKELDIDLISSVLVASVERAK